MLLHKDSEGAPKARRNKHNKAILHDSLLSTKEQPSVVVFGFPPARRVTHSERCCFCAVLRRRRIGYCTIIKEGYGDTRLPVQFRRSPPRSVGSYFLSFIFLLKLVTTGSFIHLEL